jgi:hypothetical protein
MLFSWPASIYHLLVWNIGVVCFKKESIEWLCAETNHCQSHSLSFQSSANLIIFQTPLVQQIYRLFAGICVALSKHYGHVVIYGEVNEKKAGKGGFYHNRKSFWCHVFTLYISDADGIKLKQISLVSSWNIVLTHSLVSILGMKQSTGLHRNLLIL